MSKVRYINSLKNYPARKKEPTTQHAIPLVNLLKHSMLNERRQLEKAAYYLTSYMKHSRKGRTND